MQNNHYLTLSLDITTFSFSAALLITACTAWIYWDIMFPNNFATWVCGRRLDLNSAMPKHTSVFHPHALSSNKPQYEQRTLVKVRG